MDSSFDQSGQDFMCEHRTRPKHTATDIAIRDLKMAQDGVFIRAAAKGRVIYTRDGRIDSVEDNNARTCGNSIVLIHKNGWETRYCHLKEGSITVKRGDLVDSGQKIAQIGVSGGASWPKLGFSLLYQGDFIDPFYGRTQLEGCGLSPKPLWDSVNPMNYQPFSIFNIGFSDTPPNQKMIDSGTFDKPRNLPLESDTLYLWGNFFGLQKNDEVTFTLYTPDNRVLATQTQTINTDTPKTMAVMSHDNKAHILEAGTYQGIIEISRGAGKSKKSSKWRRLLRLVKVEND